MGSEVRLRAEAKMARESERLPSRIWMLVARLERDRAEGEEALRVRARMLNVVGFGVERRLSIKARPCLPVAPAMRSVFGAGIAEKG